MPTSRPSSVLARARTVIVRHGAWLWPALVLLLAGAFALRERDQIDRIAAVLRGAEPRWVLAAVLIELAALGLIVLLYRSLLHRLDHRVALRPLARIHLQRVLVGTVTPIGGPPSLCVLVAGLRRFGVPPADALLVATLRAIVNYATFVLLLAPALLAHGPSRRVLVGALAAVAVFALFAGGIAALLRPGAAPRLARHLPRRFRAHAAGIGGHGIRPRDLLRPFALSLSVRLAGAAMLYAALRAVGETPAPLVPLAAYAIGLLFLSLAPVFGGIGVVEVATALALERMGVPASTALAAALLARLAEFWLPLALSFSLQALPLLRPTSAVLDPTAATASDTPSPFHPLAPDRIPTHRPAA